MKKKNIFSRFYLVLILAFFYLPIVYVVLFSFNSTKSLSKFTGFSLQWYEKMFASRTMLESIYYTIVVAVLATIISTVVGTIASIGLSKSRKVIKEVVTQVNNLPMLNPDIVLMLFFSTLNIPAGFGTLLLAHIIFCIPYVMLSIMPKLRQLDSNIIEAAMDLGCTPFQAITKVIIPQIKTGIFSGALVAFTMSFDDFVISYFTTGPGINNISTYVYASVKRINPSVNALSTIIILMVTVVLIVVNVVPVIRERKGKKNVQEIN